MSPLSLSPLRLLLLLAGAAARGELDTRPEHCRRDLPGCCPKEVKHVYFLHIEKTGGTYARRAIRRAVGTALPWAASGSGEAHPCNYLRHTTYDCHPSADRRQNPRCNWRNNNYYASHVRTAAHFRNGSCALTSGHHDTQLLDAFPPHVAATTLAVATLREPAARSVSHFRMLRRFNYSAATLAASAQAYLVDNPRGVARTRNKQARMLAGSYCCINGTAVQYDDDAILQRALARLRSQFCVVGIMERMQETLAYLHHVLRIPPPPNDTEGGGGSAAQGGVSGKPHGADTAAALDPALADMLRRHNALDVQLYARATERFAEQVAAMKRAGSAAGQ